MVVVIDGGLRPDPRRNPRLLHLHPGTAVEFEAHTRFQGERHMAGGASTEVAAEADSQTVTRAWKGLDADFSCRGHAYEIGRTYTLDDEPVICERGYHACLSPLDVLQYYSAEKSRYAEVEFIGGFVSESGGDSKVAARSIRIVREIDYAGLWRAHREWLGSQDPTSSATGDSGHASATGDSGHASATGVRGHASATGYSGHASATGYSAIAIAIGIGGTATAVAGGWIVLAHYTSDGSLVSVKTARCGDGGLEPGTYRLGAAGEFERVTSAATEDDAS